MERRTADLRFVCTKTAAEFGDERVCLLSSLGKGDATATQQQQEKR
jgi:hypothetical protein